MELSKSRQISPFYEFNGKGGGGGEGVQGLILI